MQKEVIKVIAGELANDNKVVDFLPNSIFSMLDERPNVSDLNELAVKIASKVGNEVNLYKNTFMPFLKEYRSIVNRLLLDRKSMSDIPNYKIKEVSIPTVFELFKDKGILIENGGPVELPISSLVIPVPTADTIKTYFRTDMLIMESAIDELLHGKSDKDLISLWEKYLLNVSGSNENISTISFRTDGDMDELALLFVLVYNLKLNPPENVTVSGDAYTKIMRNFYNKLINDIAVVLKRYNQFTNAEKLVLTLKGKEVYVISSLYRKFIADNTAEVIMGMLVSENLQSKNHYIKDILLNKDEYIKAWNKKVRLDSIATKMEATNTYKLVYEIGLKELLKDVGNDVSKYIPYTDDDNLIAARAEIAELPTSELLDVNYVTMEIVGEILLSETNFYEFTENMLEYSKLDPSLTSQEAASLATLDTIINYLMAQVKVA
jgi:hypothetical protein